MTKYGTILFLLTNLNLFFNPAFASTEIEVLKKKVKLQNRHDFNSMVSNIKKAQKDPRINKSDELKLKQIERKLLETIEFSEKHL